MLKCETQLDVLRENIETYIWTFRWLWLANLAAIVYGAVKGHYDLVGFGIISAVIAIVGVARARYGMRAVDKAASVCIQRGDGGKK